MTTDDSDVPSPIDLRTIEHAAQWAAEALAKRPQRPLFFEAMADELERSKALCVLELGSGPGFLAEHLCARLAGVSLTLLDFSDAMHTLARSRLADHLGRVHFVERSFLEPEWTRGLPVFAAVVTMQAVHELRHKRRACTLHAQVRHVLAQGGVYLVCDHYAGDDGMQNTSLFMTVEEQANALRDGGFSDVTLLRKERGLALFAARAP